MMDNKRAPVRHDAVARADLAAAQHGWSTTCRYGLLLMVRRLSAGAGAVLVCEAFARLPGLN